jgi:hypothetical protein
MNKDKYDFLLENIIKLYKQDNFNDGKIKTINKEQVKLIKYILDNINYSKLDYNSLIIKSKNIYQKIFSLNQTNQINNQITNNTNQKTNKTNKTNQNTNINKQTKIQINKEENNYQEKFLNYSKSVLAEPEIIEPQKITIIKTLDNKINNVYDELHNQQAEIINDNSNEFNYKLDENNNKKSDEKSNEKDILGNDINLTDTKLLKDTKISKMISVSDYNRQYLVFDSRYRIFTNDYSVFLYNYSDTFQSNQSVKTTFPIRNIIGMKLYQSRVPYIELANPNNKISILINEFKYQSINLSTTRNYHFLTNAVISNDNKWYSLEQEDYNEGLYKFTYPITFTSTFTFNFGDPTNILNWGVDRMNATLISALTASTITFQTLQPHGLSNGDRVYFSEFTSITPNYQIFLNIVNSPNGNKVKNVTTYTFELDAFSSSTWTIPTDLLGTTKLCYFGSKRIILAFEITCVNK